MKRETKDQKEKRQLKYKVSSRKEIVKMRAEIKIRNQQRKLKENNSCFFEIINEIKNPSFWPTKRKRENMITNIRN